MMISSSPVLLLPLLSLFQTTASNRTVNAFTTSASTLSFVNHFHLLHSSTSTAAAAAAAAAAGGTRTCSKSICTRSGRTRLSTNIELIVRGRRNGGISTSSLLHSYGNNNDKNDGDDDDDDDDDDYIKDDELKYSQNRMNMNMKSSPISFGPGRGRSTPSQRKAMGKSGTGAATVYICTNCSAEYVNWMGKCSTCK